MYLKITIAVFFCLKMVAVANADNFRCPNDNIVSTGDRISVVASKCDAPTLVSRREEPKIGEYGRTVYIEIQEWTYNGGPDTLIHILTFRNGVLVEVQTGGYGH